MADNGYSISKTTFLKFDQCPKAFFFYKNLPYLKDKPTVDKQLTFKRGHHVGYFAQQLFPGGTDVSKITENSSAALSKTAELIAARVSVIYEATFVFNGVLIMADILCLDNDKYVAYEVKSSLRVSEIYLKDAYLQFYVLTNCLPQFEDLFLVTLNPEYELEGEIDPKKLFKKRSVRQKALENVPYLQFQLDAANKVLEENAVPNIPIGRQCFKPYQCDYFSVCWKDTITDQSVFNLPVADKTTLFDWHTAGLKNIDQVPDELILKDALVKIKNAFILNEPIINAKRVESFLGRVEQPACSMDMEVWSTALPRLQHTRPFEQVPFLVSFFDGKEFTSYFTGHEADEREIFAAELIALSAPFKTVLVYDKNLEVNVIDTLANKFPALSAPLIALKSKLVDLFEVFLKMDYYHPAFKNNFSLKAVSAVLLKDINYTIIGSGLEAISYFEQYRLAANDLEREYIKTELINYCNTDTMATWGLQRYLKDLVK